MQKYLIKFTQWITTPLLLLFLFVVVNRQKVSPSIQKLGADGNYVLVANHRGMMDPFVIGYSLPLKFRPWRFFVQNRFFKNWLLLPFLYVFGCFPARKEPGKKSGLEYGIELINRGQNLVIFPEGKISRFGEKILPKTGVEILAKIPNVAIIPARVNWNRKRLIFKSYSLSIGQPFIGKNMTAEQIMDVVYSLKFR